MPIRKATDVAPPNIALNKYWGNTDEVLRLPASGSISMNLGGLTTRTTVEFSPDFAADSANVDGQDMSGAGLDRVSRHLDYARELAGVKQWARVSSASNFPAGGGIASSASGFAALLLGACTALQTALSRPG